MCMRLRLQIYAISAGCSRFSIVNMTTLDILVCTIDERVRRVPALLLPPQEGVRYVVSMQCTEEGMSALVPEVLLRRPDVTLLTLAGRGLSRNRNHALAHATAEAALIADDDMAYTLPRLRRLRQCLQDNPGTQVALFEATDREGHPMKHYPRQAMDYRAAMACRGYYPSSWEIVLRREAFARLRFNEQFGLGSGTFPCGEEEVLLHDAVRQGLEARFFPIVIGETDRATTGSRFLTDPSVQRAKGAVFAYTHSRSRARCLCLKEALHHLVFNHANPFTILRHMREGAGCTEKQGTFGRAAGNV